MIDFEIGKHLFQRGPIIPDDRIIPADQGRQIKHVEESADPPVDFNIWIGIISDSFPGTVFKLSRKQHGTVQITDFIRRTRERFGAVIQIQHLHAAHRLAFIIFFYGITVRIGPEEIPPFGQPELVFPVRIAGRFHAARQDFCQEIAFFLRHEVEQRSAESITFQNRTRIGETPDIFRETALEFKIILQIPQQQFFSFGTILFQREFPVRIHHFQRIFAVPPDPPGQRSVFGRETEIHRANRRDAFLVQSRSRRQWGKMQFRRIPAVLKFLVFIFLNDPDFLFFVIVPVIFPADGRDGERCPRPETAPLCRIGQEFFIIRILWFQRFEPERCQRGQPRTAIQPDFGQTVFTVAKEFNLARLTVRDQQQRQVRIFRAAEQQQPVFRQVPAETPGRGNFASCQHILIIPREHEFGNLQVSLIRTFRHDPRKRCGAEIFRPIAFPAQGQRIDLVFLVCRFFGIGGIFLDQRITPSPRHFCLRVAAQIHLADFTKRVHGTIQQSGPLYEAEPTRILLMSRSGRQSFDPDFRSFGGEFSCRFGSTPIILFHPGFCWNIDQLHPEVFKFIRAGNNQCFDLILPRQEMDPHSLPFRV